jgi:hypothetical protein
MKPKYCPTCHGVYGHHAQGCPETPSPEQVLADEAAREEAEDIACERERDRQWERAQEDHYTPLSPMDNYRINKEPFKT